MNWRIVTTFTALSGLIALAAGCGSSGGGALTTVIGQIVDDGTLQPLSGATARVGRTASEPTAADGRFTITGAPTGNQTLTITAPGHQRTQRAVSLIGGTNDVGVCYLPPDLAAGNGAITGTVVLAAGGTPVSGATIVSGSATAVSRSDGSGRFTLYNVPAKMVQVTFNDPATGATAWRFVTVTAGLPPVDIGTVTLSQGPPPPPVP